jgi:hypothetical protein
MRRRSATFNAGLVYRPEMQSPEYDFASEAEVSATLARYRGPGVIAALISLHF